MPVVDATSLVLHVLAAAAIVGGAMVQVMAGARLRTATTGREAAQWASFARSGGFVLLVAALLSLMTGGHLAGAVWGGDRGGFSNPFITVGLLGWLLLLPVGPMIGGARLRRLGEQAQALGDGLLPAELATEARAPGLWGPVTGSLGAAGGLIWMMIAKPGWGASVVGLLVAFAIGWVAGAVAAGGSRSAA
jgi:hypothetical protein